jgi:CheY-like chemotaxis protein
VHGIIQPHEQPIGAGEYRWMEGRGRGVYAPDGAPRWLYGLGIDITDRKRAEQAIAAAREAADADAERLNLALEAVLLQVAFLDIGLPVMDGYELAGRLRDLPSLSEVRLVAITGYGQDSDRERSASAGFHHHLVKPVNLSAVDAVLAALDARGRGPVA